MHCASREHEVGGVVRPSRAARPPGARRGDPRHGWPVLLLAALLGAGVGATVPRAERTAAAFVDDAALAGTFAVRPCSYAWSAAVASLTPTRHEDFAAAGALPGNAPSPGLLICDPSGALRLSGAYEESVPDPAGAMDAATAASVVLWVSITDVAAPGDLLWLSQDDGSGLGLRVAGGLLELVEAPADGGPPAVLAQAAVPDGEPHLLAVTLDGAGAAQLWVDASAVATAPLSGAAPAPVTLRLGTRPGSGAASARAVLDEVVVLPAPLDAGALATLVAANRW